MAEIGPARADLRALFIARSLVGAALGALAVAAVRAILDLAPDSTITLALWLSGSVPVFAGALAGTVVGVLCAASAAGHATHVIVSEGRIEVIWHDARVSVPRRLVQAVVAGRDVVILGRGGVELARAPGRVDLAALQRMLESHGYDAALTAEPDEHRFRAWSEGDAVGRDVRRLLAARAELVAAGSVGDAETLRRRLANAGIMVRDRRVAPWFQRRQEWRAAPGAVHPSVRTASVGVPTVAA